MCYHNVMKQHMTLIAGFLLLCGALGCTRTLSALPPHPQVANTVVVGHVMTTLLAPTTRWYTPELRFFELMHHPSEERIRVAVQSDNSWFILVLRPGDYELTRILFNEGPFQEAGYLGIRFQVAQGQVTYVGTWRFGMDPPRNQRTVLLSTVAEAEDTVREALTQYQNILGRPVVIELPSPSTTEMRLYEVPPYPRIWWFRREPTT